MTLRSLGRAVMPALVAAALAGSAQTASAGATSIHQYRLNEFTGDTDDFAAPSLLQLEGADPDGAGPLGLTGVTGLGSGGSAPALAVAAVPGCGAGTRGTVTRLCPGYAFGFSQGVALSGGPGESAGHHLTVIELLLFDDGRRRKIHDF